MQTPRTMLAALMATGQALACCNGVLATPFGGAVGQMASDRSPPLVLPVQNAERLDRLWQHRSILERALQAPPDAAPAQPPARPRQVPAPQAEHSAIPVQPETAAAPEQTAEAPAAAVSCEEAATIVADYGFSAIQPTACTGHVYRFSASRDGTAYSIGVAAAAGEITEVTRE